MDKIFSTQFPELGFTHVTNTQICVARPRHVDEWRFVDLTGETPTLVGTAYPTRELLIASLPAYAAEFGCQDAMTGKSLHDAYRAAVAADDAWMKELHRVFGALASMARYDSRGISTPRLKELRTIWRAAEDARHTLTMIRRDFAD
jgi:hypothetical protein